MDALDFARSKALNNIPQKKLLDILDTIENSNDTDQYKMVKKIAFNRYAESNIPIEYWFLKMDKDFKGDSRLLQKYNEYISDLKASYLNGTSICFAGGHGVGKQISLDTDIPTPNGFIKLIDLKEGDQLFDENGDICNVIKLHPIDLKPISYEITFDSGEKIKACKDHLWLTWTKKDRVKNKIPTVKTTEEIFKTLRFSNGSRKAANHSIICSKPLKYNHKDLPIDPYLFGLWLGDGDIYNGYIESEDFESFSNFPHEIIKSSVRNDSKSVSIKFYGLRKELKKIGFLKKRKTDNALEKHIPQIYLQSSVDQRLELLRGLLDSDGCCNKIGAIEFCSCIERLANDTCQLVKSLGIKSNVKKSKSFLNGVRSKDRYRVCFTTILPVFNLKRKLNNIRDNKTQMLRTTHRFIVDVKKIEPVPMRCITVDSLSHLFLITKSFIPTHNTMTVTCVLKRASQKGYSCLYSTLSDIVHVVTQGIGEDKFLAKRELALVDFLVIDEFDSRFMPSENAADLYARSLEGVFRSRSQNKLPTLMCTNSPNIVESFNGPLKQSIDSLMHGYLKTFPVFGEDFRKKKQ